MTCNTNIPQHALVLHSAPYTHPDNATLQRLTSASSPRHHRRGPGLAQPLPLQLARDYLPRLWLCHTWPTFDGWWRHRRGRNPCPDLHFDTGFSRQDAIPLASIIVLGGAIANNLLYVRKVHPDHPDRPAIDWELMLLLQPMTIAGALIGVDLNKVLPEILLLVHMLTLLTVTARETTKKAHKMYRDEEMCLAQGGTSPALSWGPGQIFRVGGKY